MSTKNANTRFAKSLFGGSDDGDQGLDDDEQKQRSDAADDGLTADRQFAADLFAPDDPDANVIAGLVAGRTVGRTSPPRRDETPHNEFRFS
jgi:hypothetical protein